jgi:hypothetical protein
MISVWTSLWDCRVHRKERLHLGDCRSIDQSSTLFASESQLQCEPTCGTLCGQHPEASWGSKEFVSDRGPQFTAQFWKSLHASMGTKLNYSTASPQTDGQTERVNQVLEDLLRACVLTYGSV